jgi:hypothetical protein
MDLARLKLRGGRLAFLAVLSLTGCVSARMSDDVSDQLFRAGQYDQAAARLDAGRKAQGANGRDSLLFLLDLGLAHHSAGQYEESNQAFQKADKIAEIKGYTSLSAEVGTLFTSENLKDYQGEDFEKVLINTYLAINYALMGNFEDSRVELKRANHKLEMMISVGKKKYQQSAFSRYLSGILFEADRNFNDAYVDYQKTSELRPDLPGLGLDLWRCAKELSMPDEMERWDEEYHLTPEDHKKALATGSRSSKAEIIVLYENGISPVKRPNPQFESLPRFYPRWNPVYSAAVEMRNLGKQEEFQRVGITAVFEDIESTAIRNLDEKYGGMIAKKLAGIAAKEVLASSVEDQTKSPLLGFMMRLLMYGSDQADLRSWNLLPRDLQVLRWVVDPGTYQIKLTPQGSQALKEKTVQVKSGKKVFLNFRYMP